MSKKERYKRNGRQYGIADQDLFKPGMLQVHDLCLRDLSQKETPKLDISGCNSYFPRQILYLCLFPSFLLLPLST